MASRTGLLGILGVLAACGRVAPTPDAVPAAGGPACTAQALELRTWLDEVLGEQAFRVPPAFPLVIGEGRPLDDGVEVALQPGALSLESAGEVAAGELAAALAGQRQALAAGSGGREAVNLSIEPATPWARVVAVIDAARAAGFTRVAFVVQHPSALSSPGPSSADAELTALDAGDASAKASGLAKIVSRIVVTCPALVKAFGELGAVRPEDRPRFYARAVPEAIVACGCRVDDAALRDVSFVLFSGDGRAISAIEATLAPTGTVVAAPGAMPWAAASAKVFAAARAGGPLALRAD